MGSKKHKEKDREHKRKHRHRSRSRERKRHKHSRKEQPTEEDAHEFSRDTYYDEYNDYSRAPLQRVLQDVGMFLLGSS